MNLCMQEEEVKVLNLILKMRQKPQIRQYIDEVTAAITDDLLSDDENIEFDSVEFHEMFDEISFFIRKKLYDKIQDHYDKVRTDY